MILFGCLLAFSAAVAPRLVLILAWIFGSRWDAVWDGNILLPILGIVFLPYTTIMYLLAWSPAIGGAGNIEGWDWMWIVMGLFLDVMKWGQMFANRKEAAKQTQKYYPSGAPRTPTGTGTTSAMATAVPASAPAASPAPAAPAVPPAPAATPAPDPTPAVPAESAPPDEAQLDKLHDSGALSDEEFEAAKAKLDG